MQLKMICCAILVSSACAAGADPTDPQPKFAAVGVGATKCATFLETSSDEVMESFTLSWVQGYLTATNIWMSRAQGRQLVTLPTHEYIKAAVLEYCRKFPQKEVMRAASAVFVSAATLEGWTLPPSKSTP